MSTSAGLSLCHSACSHMAMGDSSTIHSRLGGPRTWRQTRVCRVREKAWQSHRRAGGDLNEQWDGGRRQLIQLKFPNTASNSKEKTKQEVPTKLKKKKPRRCLGGGRCVNSANLRAPPFPSLSSSGEVNTFSCPVFLAPNWRYDRSPSLK